MEKIGTICASLIFRIRHHFRRWGPENLWKYPYTTVNDLLLLSYLLSKGYQVTR